MTQRTIKTCSIDGCSKNVYVISRGLCSTHYQRYLRHGDPSKLVKFRDAEDSFNVNTVWENSCLIWIGYKGQNGYGRIASGSVMTSAHRYAWEREHGPISDGMMIDHICHNRACCNVEHLRLATHGENMSNLAGPQKNNRTSGVRNVYRLDIFSGGGR